MNLSTLSEDQLLQLIKAVTEEVAQRAIAIQMATNKYWQDASEEIFENIKNSQDPADGNRSQTTDERAKATVVNLLKSLDFFKTYRYDSFSISIWEKNGDIRLYL
jgi:DNA-binding transcriptional regulator YdaS (Cro superfamily)